MTTLAWRSQTSCLNMDRPLGIFLKNPVSQSAPGYVCAISLTGSSVVLSYQPGTKNLKPDALSRQWDLNSLGHFPSKETTDLHRPPMLCESRKWAPPCIGFYKILCHINPLAYHLNFTWSLINPTFHMSQLKPVLCSSLARATAAMPLQTHIISGAPL